MPASRERDAQPRGLPVRQCMAWAVHLLTASGGAAGVMAIVETAHHRWIAAFVWMIVAIAIDSVDGPLARLCNVKRVLPQFDGALLDNIVDYFTYVIVPAFFLYESGLVPPRCGLPAALTMTLVSAYQFCQADAKTDDCFFKGFPSYWNVVVFYLFMMPLGGWVNLFVVAVLAVAVFVPVKYLYPSRTVQLRFLTLTLTALWG
ncbi:MAG: phosphatidylcholine synthase, partial [Nitrospiraceae bacterium]|nr:phosphatidylcholine synthase [Nitrospiraceae bacterium]